LVSSLETEEKSAIFDRGHTSISEYELKKRLSVRKIAHFSSHTFYFKFTMLLLCNLTGFVIIRPTSTATSLIGQATTLVGSRHKEHIMSFWEALRIGSSGLTAQRLRLDLISNNIANAQTTHTEEGGPYQRQDVVFIAEGKKATFPPQSVAARRGGLSDLQGGVRATQIITDTEEGPRVYDPTHPDADADGYVGYPNVDIVVEMTNMLSATRSYEANLAVIEAVKRMALKALEIGR
jgi:flagellar basal-body rod protein FlgC